MPLSACLPACVSPWPAEGEAAVIEWMDRFLPVFATRVCSWAGRGEGGGRGQRVAESLKKGERGVRQLPKVALYHQLSDNGVTKCFCGASASETVIFFLGYRRPSENCDTRLS